MAIPRMSKETKGGFYAVREGRTTGVFSTWKECETQTKGHPGAEYKRFANATDAEAFVSGASSPTISPIKSDDKGKKRAIHEDGEDESGWDVVYSDGACKGNGKPGSVAGVGVWWGENDYRNIAERCPGDQTNNRAELIAIVRVLETSPMTKKPLLIKTDSQYSIECFQSWLPKWRKNNFRTASGGPVKNLGIIQYLSALLDVRAKSGQKIRLKYVKGHSGNTGNDGADAQANRGTLEPPAPDRNWAQLLAQVAALSDEVEMDYQSQDSGDTIDVPLEVDDDVFSTPAGSPSKVRRVVGTTPLMVPAGPSMATPQTESHFSKASSSPMISSPPAPTSPTPGASSSTSPANQKSRWRLQEGRIVDTGSPGKKKAIQQALMVYPLLPESPVKSPRKIPGSFASGKMGSGLSGTPEGLPKSDEQSRLLGSERAKSCALNLYPTVPGERSALVERLPHSPQTQKKMMKHIDLDSVIEPVRSPSKATKSRKLAQLPSASERHARSMSPAPVHESLARAMWPIATVPKLTAADINPEDYADCFADDAELLEDLDDL